MVLMLVRNIHTSLCLYCFSLYKKAFLFLFRFHIALSPVWLFGQRDRILSASLLMTEPLKWLGDRRSLERLGYRLSRRAAASISASGWMSNKKGFTEGRKTVGQHVRHANACGGSLLRCNQDTIMNARKMNCSSLSLGNICRQMANEGFVLWEGDTFLLCIKWGRKKKNKHTDHKKLEQGGWHWRLCFNINGPLEWMAEKEQS